MGPVELEVRVELTSVRQTCHGVRYSVTNLRRVHFIDEGFSWSRKNSWCSAGIALALALALAESGVGGISVWVIGIP